MRLFSELRRFAVRLVSPWRASSDSRELDEEIQTHLELLAADHRARGLTADRARAAALRDFGGVLRTREAHRELRIFAWLDTLGQDLRYAVRSYRRTPLFTFVAVSTLALAIGASTAMFSLLNALDWRELPVRDPGSLVQVATLAPPVFQNPGGFSYPALMALERQQTVFSSVIPWSLRNVSNVDVNGRAVPGLVLAVGGNFFSELGFRPAAGRFIVDNDVRLETLRPAQVVVLGYGFWQRQFGADPGVIGRTIQIEKVPFTIIGVAPRLFTGFSVTVAPAVIIPLTAYRLVEGLTADSLETGPTASISIAARLKRGVTLDQARAQLQTLWPAIRERTIPTSFSEAQRETARTLRLSVTSAATGLEPHLRKRFSEPLVILLGIALLVLIIACVNIASLIVSRMAARSQEIGIRVALGAGRGRLVRQMLTEGLLLSLAGAAAGVVMAWWCSGAIVRIMLADYVIPASLDVAPDGRVLGFATGLAILAGALCTAIPAWKATMRSGSAGLSSRTRAIGTVGRTGRRLIAAQIALSLGLLAPAGLLVQTLREIRAVDRGMDTHDIVIAFPGPRPGGYGNLNNDVYYPEVLGRLAAIPGVERAAVSLMLPGRGSGITGFVAARGGSSSPTRGLAAGVTEISPGFFSTLDIPVREGRDFDWSDNSRGRHVAIVSEALARKLFGDGEAIGRHVRVGTDPGQQDLEIVGVVGNTRLYDVKSANLYAAYVPALQDPDVNYKCFVLRGSGISARAIERAVDSLGQEQVTEVQALDDIVGLELLRERMTADFAAFFGGLALLLAAIGLYGLMSYAVAQRRREIGVRVALGAQPRRVMGEVVCDGLRVALGGIACGIGAALVTVSLVKSLLFGLTPDDPATLIAACFSLLAVALVACLGPALRAARVDPMTALRTE